MKELTQEQRQRAKEAKRRYYERNKALTIARAKAWKAANPEKVKAGAKVYRDANSEAQAKLVSAWQKANPDKVRAKARKHYQSNPEPIRQKSRAWHAQNTDTANERSRVYRQRPEYRAQSARYRELRVAALSTGTLSKDIVAQLMRKQDGRCFCCGKPLTEYHLDHWVPLSKGGTNTDDNMRLLLPVCNLQKADWMPDDFMRLRRGAIAWAA